MSESQYNQGWDDGRNFERDVSLSEIARLTAEVERLGRCLRIAAGMLSTNEEFERCHPEGVLACIEAAEVGSRSLDGEP